MMLAHTSSDETKNPGLALSYFLWPEDQNTEPERGGEEAEPTEISLETESSCQSLRVLVVGGSNQTSRFSV